MFHPGTTRLIEYWRQQRGDYDLPLRATIDPSHFPDLVPQAFMLGREGPGRYPVRLAGGFVGDVHQRDLRGVSALTLWAPTDRPALQVALERARANSEPFVVRGEIRADDVAPVGLEVLFAPVADATGEAQRFFGLYQPTGLMHRLRGKAASELGAHIIESPTHIEAPRLRLAAVNGRRIA